MTTSSIKTSAVASDLKSQIRAILATDDRAVEMAVLVIDGYQTQDEQATKATRHLNGRGWGYHDASTGGYLAGWLKKSPNNRLTGRFLPKGRRLATRYAGQLTGRDIGHPELDQQSAEPKALPEVAGPVCFDAEVVSAEVGATDPDVAAMIAELLAMA
jgi:hypothetical protein